MRAVLTVLGVWVSCNGAARADLDVAFVLDTTGSMGGELREAKERVRQISEALVNGRRDERVRLAVVAFRDRGDDYVTQYSELSSDVEDSQAFLAALDADGGGDGPEDVLSGLWVALDALDWGPRPRTDREVFLIGDAPPHLDYDGHVTTDQLIQQARAGEHVIHTIGCRSLPRDGVEFFRHVAYATEGSYQHIGAVRLGSTEEGDLAGAVLDALATRRARSFSPLVLDWSRPASEAVSPGLRASLVASAASGCLLHVTTPSGVALTRAPAVGLEQDTGVVVRLDLTAGESEHWQAALPSCSSDARVHVQIGAP